MNRNEGIAFVVGLLIGGLATNAVIASEQSHNHSHGDTHQITQPDEEYHVHADFLVYVNDEKVDLNRKEFMTTSENELHDDVHLHDDNGEVLHLHAPGVTFAEFLHSLSITLTNDCLTIDNKTYCDTDDTKLQLYVNSTLYEGDISNYEPRDDDAVLLYYGSPESNKVTDYLDEVKNDACYYSGTCPERGVAPPESCGLTCEL